MLMKKISGFIGLMMFLLPACNTQVVTQPSELPATPTAISTATADIRLTNLWKQRATMPTARSEMPAVELNGLIYVPGGFGPVPGGLANGKGPVTTFDVYDPASDQWRSLAPMPEPRHHLMLTAYHGMIYVFGGFIDPWITQSNTWVYDPATNHWTVLKPMPAPRTAGAAVTLGDYIYVVGGTTSTAGLVLPTWRYDPEADSWKDVAPVQQAREHNTAVVLNGHIYALGGRWATTLNSVEIYDPAEDRWTKGPDMIGARAGFGATVMDGRIYVAGGELIEILQTLNSVEVFDPAVGAWSQLPAMPGKLHGVPLVGVNGVLYIFGGSARSADVINWGRVFAFQP
jgi:N-acetylneuraminic acid mutarotase